MRKILIDDVTIKTMLNWLSLIDGDYKQEAKPFVCFLEKTIKESEQQKISVIEWHKMDEVPEDGSEILLRFKSGRISCNVAVVLSMSRWQLAVGVKEFPVEWAYMPE